MEDVEKEARLTRAAEAQVVGRQCPSTGEATLIFPSSWIAWARFAFNIPPPHVFCPFRIGPEFLAGDRTTLATGASVQIEDSGNLNANVQPFSSFLSTSPD